MKKIILSATGIAALVNLGATEMSTNPILQNNDNSSTSVQENCISNFDVNKTVLLERESLTKEGFISIYSKLINKPDNERKAIAKFIREDFSGFMQAHFVLKENHIKCLNTVWNSRKDVEFISTLANFVEKGNAITKWDINVPAIDAPVGKKKKKVEAGYKKGWYIGVTIEF